MLEKISMAVSILSMSLLGLFVVLRNLQNVTYRLFGLLTLTGVLWTIASFASNHISGHDAQLFANKLSLFIGFLLIQSVWLLSMYFPYKAKTHKYQVLSSVILSPILLYICLFTDKIVLAVKFNTKQNLTEIASGQFYGFYIFLAALFFIYMTFNLINTYKNSLTSGTQKQQIRYAATGLLLAFIWAVLTAVVIPIIVNSWEISKVGPAGLIFLVGFVSYAIIKHRLFDIRLIIARAIGYVLTLSTLVGLYALVIFVITASVLDGTTISMSQQIFYILMTLVFGFSLSPLKRFFDKLTNKLFYKDAYDAQLLLDKFNQTLVGNIELDAILKQSSDMLASTIKTEFVAFIIRETEGTNKRASYSKIVELNTDDILRISSDKKKTHLIITDELEIHDKHKTVLTKNNVSVAASLTSAGKDGEHLGFLLLGPKQSGNPYNKQDLQVLDIIANELVIAIQNALRFEEIETFNITLQQKVNDATRQLRQTNEKLKTLDETKDEFISMASHQLRTPLTAVKGYVSMVVEGDAGKLNKQQKELLDQAFASSQRMVYLIADLLNVSRLRSGKFVIENKPTMLADVVESEMEQLTDMANSKDQTLTYVKPDKFPTLAMDETKIRQVIMNFADNALHYTPNGGHIQIHLEDKGDTIEYTVVDDGLGVPKAEQHHLFTKFFRAGNAKKARPDGTGLGLFMAKKVVIAQGGSIIFKSEENKGSTFGFVFPKAKMLVNEGKSETAKTEKAEPKAAKKTTASPKKG